MARRMSAREAMATVRCAEIGNPSELSLHSDKSWFLERADQMVRHLRRLGFTVVALPKRRKAGRK